MGGRWYARQKLGAARWEVAEYALYGASDKPFSDIQRGYVMRM
ncbi:hypothetical protein C2W64_01909 [Brevibacillus laterosporus]|nr:hypothetical protein C2W64_01909 [Brevibacillus laterosporus]